MTFILEAIKREVKGEKVREKGQIPAVVYGAGGEAVSLSIEKAKFEKLYEGAGESTLIDLKVDGKDEGKILVQEVQRDPVNDRVMHVDLKRIDMNKPLTAYVSLNFIGVSDAVKNFGGILVKNVEEVEVECLPKDLVSEIEVDLTALATFDDAIKVGDLKLPAGFKVLNPAVETPVVSVSEPLSDEQIAAMEAETADVSKVEVEGEKKESADADAVADGEGKDAKVVEKK